MNRLSVRNWKYFDAASFEVMINILVADNLYVWQV
jgi:hypothetical protein